MRQKNKKKPGRTVSFWLHDETVKKLDRLANKAEISRSELLGNIIEIVADDLYKCDKVGVWRFSIIMRDFQETLKDWVCNCFDDPEHVGNCVGEDKVGVRNGDKIERISLDQALAAGFRPPFAPEA